MIEKHYVIQWRGFPRGEWNTIDRPFKTVDDAVSYAKRCRYNLDGKHYRIAESYVQIRYKAIKT